MSDSNMTGLPDLVVGTAGHIDHGKTELIRALTGMDTDRLVEEKRRGISIDLGFAHTELEGGRHISFIDVPGHERFVRNMLAGVAGIQAVMLVVAANELIKPQTREHLEICRLLGVEKGIVVLTKSDLVGADELVAAGTAVRNFVAGSFLSEASVVAVSAKTGAGLAELRAEILRLATTESLRAEDNLARLPVDRSFTLKGFGTIVTGTLWSGTLRTGNTVHLHPQNRPVRIRGLQVNGRAVQQVNAGCRTAVNLSGIDAVEIERGSVLIAGAEVQARTRIQASVDWLPGASQPHRREDFQFHLGTAETTARMKLLSRRDKAERFWAELTFDKPVVAMPGDRFVLRRPSPSNTAGGGVVLDTYPPRRLNREKSAARLERLAGANLPDRLALLVGEKENGRAVKELSTMTGTSPEETTNAVRLHSELLLTPSNEHVVNKTWLARRRDTLLEWLTTFHRGNPSSAAAPSSAARLGLDADLFGFVVTGFAPVRVTAEGVALSSHRALHNATELAALSRIESSFLTAGYQPATVSEMLKSAAPSLKQSRDLLEHLIRTKRLIRVSEDLVFHSDVIRHIRESLASHKGRRFSVADFKTWTQISRKYAIPLLEYLDHQRVTRREGDFRVVL